MTILALAMLVLVLLVLLCVLGFIAWVCTSTIRGVALPDWAVQVATGDLRQVIRSLKKEKAS